ncbi:MAG: nitronate monooxygenase, partial [Stellaceae bacterium]
ADGRGLAAALALGAEGVLVGTRFYATAESLAHDAAKARVVAASGETTLRTTIFDIVRGLDWPKPYTGRALSNAFCGRWHGREGELTAAQTAEMQRYKAAVEAGDFGTAVIFAGEDVDLIDDVPPAATIVARLADEAEHALRSAVRRLA